MSDSSPAPFDQLVFRGGGLRCFWHGGFLETLTDGRPLTPRRVTGSSGGALSAAAWVLGIETELRDRFAAAMREIKSNVTVNDLDDEDGRSVHQRVYDGMIRGMIDSVAQVRIAAGLAFQISVSTPGQSLAPSLITKPLPVPRRSVPKPSANSLHPFAGHWHGTATDRCATGGARGPLARSDPDGRHRSPAFRPDEWNGKMVFDGGMVDKAPMPEPGEGRTLVLPTKRFQALPEDEDGRITFVQPESDILPGRKLDFTDPDLVSEAWNQGRDDGRR